MWFSEKFNAWFEKQSKKAWERSQARRKQEEHERVANSATPYVPAAFLDNGPPVRRLNSKGFGFAIYPATGGYVVEYRPFDEATNAPMLKTASSYPEVKLHVIPSDKDLGEELSRIVTFENLRA